MSLIPTILYLNGSAGNGESARLRDKLHGHMRALDWRVTVIEEADRSEGLAQLAELLPETRIVLVAGGDGTLNGVIATVMNHEADTVVGIVPAGTGNDFARAIGLDCSTEEAAARLFYEHRIKSVDVGKVYWVEDSNESSSYFLNVCGMGLDAEIALNSSRYAGLGRASYLAAALESLLASPSQQGRITVDDEVVVDGEFHLASVANGKYAGGGFVLMPEATPVDALFDLGVVIPGSKFELLKLLNQARRDGRGESDALVAARGEKIMIESDEPVAVHLDGEVVALEAKKLGVSMLPSSLRMIIPTESPI